MTLENESNYHKLSAPDEVIVADEVVPNLAIDPSASTGNDQSSESKSRDCQSESEIKDNSSKVSIDAHSIGNIHIVEEVHMCKVEEKQTVNDDVKGESSYDMESDPFMIEILNVEEMLSVHAEGSQKKDEENSSTSTAYIYEEERLEKTPIPNYTPPTVDSVEIDIENNNDHHTFEVNDSSNHCVLILPHSSSVISSEGKKDNSTCNIGKSVCWSPKEVSIINVAPLVRDEDEIHSTSEQYPEEQYSSTEVTKRSLPIMEVNESSNHSEILLPNSSSTISNETKKDNNKCSVGKSVRWSQRAASIINVAPLARGEDEGHSSSEPHPEGQHDATKAKQLCCYNTKKEGYCFGAVKNRCDVISLSILIASVLIFAAVIIAMQVTF